MKNSTVWQILKSFSREDFKNFEDFALSPYYNKNTNIVKLVKYLRKNAPLNNDELLKKENIWKELFGNKDFNYGVMKNVIYDAGKNLNMFMTAETQKNKHLDARLKQLQFLFSKELTEQLRKGIKLFRSDLSKISLSEEYFYYNFNLEMFDKGISEKYLKTKAKDFGNYNDFNKNLLSYFFSVFFMANNKGLLVSSIYSQNYENEDLSKVLTFFEKEYKESDILSTLYYYSVRLNSEKNNEELFNEVKNFVFKNFESFDRRTQYNSCVNLLRFCSHFTLSDDTKYSKEIFEIIKFMLSHNVYNSYKYHFIDQSYYYMAVDIAVHLNESVWCENFINEYKEKLNPSIRDNYFNMSMMLLKRSLKDFTGSLEYLSKVIPDSSLIKLTIKEFELKNYYDLGYYEEIYSLIKNNKNFSVNDKSFSKVTLSSLNNLLKYLEKFLDIKQNPNNKKNKIYLLEKLEIEIRDLNVFNKSWLNGIIVSERLNNLTTGSSKSVN